jgi:hypothetical protein
MKDTKVDLGLGRTSHQATRKITTAVIMVVDGAITNIEAKVLSVNMDLDTPSGRKTQSQGYRLVRARLMRNDSGLFK